MSRSCKPLSTPVASPLTSLTASVLIGGILWCSAGCNRFTETYGPSNGTVGQESLNGFGALRQSFENAGFQTREVKVLNERVGLTSTIVWTPQQSGAIPLPVTEWFENWLGRGNRTLVYIIPDSGSAADYWAEAAALAPPDQRLEYRRRAARERNRRLMWRLNRRPVASNGWFVLAPLEHQAKVSSVSRDWASDETSDLNFSTEYEIQFYDKDAVEVHNESVAGTGAAISTATGPNGGWSVNLDVEPTDATYQFESLLAGDAMLNPEVDSAKQTPSREPRQRREVVLAAKVTCEDWPDSKVIVINSGALLTNYAFTRPANRRLAEKLIESSTVEGDAENFAGFVTSSGSSIVVRSANPGLPKATGMEMLTVWPISLITIHGVLFGLVVCLMLFPIFGRPRRIKRESQSDFGDHLDAVAALMRKTGGEKYARHRVSEYMKRVRGEVQGPWVIDSDDVFEASETPPTADHDRAHPKQPAANRDQSSGGGAASKDATTGGHDDVNT